MCSWTIRDIREFSIASGILPVRWSKFVYFSAFFSLPISDRTRNDSRLKNPIV